MNCRPGSDPPSGWGALVAQLGVAAALCIVLPFAARAERSTVLYEQRVEVVDDAVVEGQDLWLPLATAERVSGFSFKPAGACRDEICVPLLDKQAPVVETRSGAPWVSLTRLARQLEQAVVYDGAAAVWSFGVVPAVAEQSLQSATAPDFELPDRQGKMVRLSSFRGRKVLILSWASW